MLKQKIVQKITNTPNLGLLPHIKNDNDFKFGLFGFRYKPKHKKLELETLSTKDQYKNTCGWNASTGAKERDENCLLDPRTMVLLGKREGKISGDGFSSLKGNEEILKNFGVGEEKLITRPYRNWKEYSDISLLSQKVLENCSTHRSDSYWEVERLSEVYKALDEGRTVKIGIDWYTGYNMNNGFKSPFIIEKESGYRVGGHAIFLEGYDHTGNKIDKKILTNKNSFGEQWGDKGNFYITEDMLIKNINKYGAFVNMDIKSDIGKALMEMDGKDVKVEGNPAVYHIQRGVKKVYPDEITFEAFDRSWKKIELVKERILNEIPNGDNMDITKSVYWDFIKSLKAPHNLYRLRDLYLIEK